MSLFNIFDPKKKQYQTPANQIQGSGYSSAYASNPTTQQSFSSAYSSPTPTMPKTPVPTPAPAPQKPQTPSYTPVRQVSSNQTTDYKNYQGSGYGSNYASNPTNYVPPTPRPTNTTQPDANTSWLNYVKDAAQRQAQFAQKMGQQGQDFIKQKYGLANQQLTEQLPQAQELFNKFKTNTEATIADLLASGEMQKSQAKDYYGDVQRQAAQTLRETQGQTQRTFANLGSLDSRGEGSYQQANENIMSDFNRYTQQNLKAQADQLTQIDMAVASARREAEATIVSEEAKMNELARNIQYAIANNNLQQAQELTDAYNQSQQYIYDIQDSLAQTEYQFALEQEKLKNEMAKVQSFTPEFMATGVPTNQAEYEFLVKNKDAVQGLYGGNNSSGQKVSNIVGQLLNMNTSGLTGRIRLGVTDEARSAEGLLKQLSSELQIEEAKRLKGQGSMSDAERTILANSIAAFNLDKNGKPMVSDDRFRQILEELQANTGVASNQNQTIRVVQKSTGQTGTIPISEFDPTLYTEV